MTDTGVPSESWVERAVERSAAVQRSRSRIANQVRLMLDAARRLISENGGDFTTQDLVAEAGVALQTFYRYFASKDELLLAVIGDAMTEACDRWGNAAADIPDPMDRLRLFITAPLEQFDGDRNEAAGMRFIVSTHWHLHRIFPTELALRRPAACPDLHGDRRRAASHAKRGVGCVVHRRDAARGLSLLRLRGHRRRRHRRRQRKALAILPDSARSRASMNTAGPQHNRKDTCE
jgi:AcrR family transcriptional regulator